MVRTSKTGVEGEKIKIGKYTEDVLGKTIPVEYDMFALQDAARISDVNGFLGRVIAQSQAETVQRSLIDRAAAPGAYERSRLGETVKTMTVDAILNAKMAWGEKVAMFSPGNRPGLYVHSKQFEDLAQTADYKSLGTASTTSIVEIEQMAGAQAIVHGVPIYPLDSVPNSGGLTLTGITRASAVATATATKTIQVPDANGLLTTATVGHGLRVGDIVTITGADQAEYNGNQTVVTVPSATTFTFAVSGSPATPATGTLVVTANYTALMLMPGALGLTVKDVVTGQVYSYPGTTVKQVDTHYRWLGTRFRRWPVPVVKVVTR
jgi:hypothetical protein